MARHQMRRVLLGLLVAIMTVGIVQPTVRAASAPTANYSQFAAWPAAATSIDGTSDLDGDGLGDVLSVRRDWYQPDGETSYFLGGEATVRRGTDGRRLLSLQSSSIWNVFAMRVGKPARPGVVVESINVTPKESDQWQFSVTLTGLDVVKGTTLWTWTSPRGVAVDVGIPFYVQSVGPDQTVAGLPARAHASQLLVRLASEGELPGPPNEVPMVVSGADGSAHPACLASCLANAIPLPDLDRDGYADLADDGGPGTTTYSSVTREMLWTRTDLNYPTPLPDVNGDHTGDVLAVGSGTGVVVNGATGATLYEVPESELEPLGDSNGDGTVDLVATSQVRQVATATAYSGRTGARLWHRSFQTWSDVQPAHDVDGDGVRDFYVNVGSGSAEHHYIINGRNGSLRDGARLDQPLLAAVDGHGADFVRVDSSGDMGTATIVDGATRKPVWTYRAKGLTAYDIAAARLNADSHADVLVRQYPPAREVMIDGATGKVRWSIPAK